MTKSMKSAFSPQAVEAIELGMNQCSEDLGLPVILILDPDETIIAGSFPAELFDLLERETEQVWADAAHEAVEAVKYINAKIENQTYHLYTQNLGHGVLLGVGWMKTVSITQLRAECDDLSMKIQRWY